MSCLVFLAFTFEANLNFIGDHFIKGWKEKSPFDSKVKNVFELFNIEYSKNTRPYSSIALVKKFRDTLAHGKPVRQKFDEIVEGTSEELEKRAKLIGEWEDVCKPETVFMVYEDVDCLWKQMMGATGLKVWDTITRSQWSIAVLERLTDDSNPGTGSATVGSNE